MKIKLPILLLHLCFVITTFAQAPDRQQFIRRTCDEPSGAPRLRRRL